MSTTAMADEKKPSMQNSQAPRALAATVRAVDALNNLLTKFCGLLCAVMVLSAFYGVLVRFALPVLGLHVVAPWTDEVARYMMIWLIFVGGAVAARQAKLIGIEVLVHALPPRAGNALKYSAHALSLTFYSIVFVIGIEWLRFGGSETSPVLRIPMSYVYASMAVGALLMLLNTIAVILDAIASGRHIRDAQIHDELEDAMEQLRAPHSGASDEKRI